MDKEERNTEQLFKEGLAALDRGATDVALERFEAASEVDESPEILSYLAYCLAREQRDFSRAVGLCREAIDEDPGRSLHYLNLGRIYLLDGSKNEAIRTFRDGLLREYNRGIVEELRKLGIRKYPVISSLPREHPLNRVLGKVLKRMKMR
jgi:tetratricopeptide (TPR) repeat protein